jgi:hypothetical protein
VSSKRAEKRSKTNYRTCEKTLWAIRTNLRETKTHHRAAKQHKVRKAISPRIIKDSVRAVKDSDKAVNVREVSSDKAVKVNDKVVRTPVPMNGVRPRQTGIVKPTDGKFP